jgi:hypothetical protein
VFAIVRRYIGGVSTFFISPAYSVPRMTISFSAKLMETEVAEVIPVVQRLAGKAPAL